MAEAGQVLSRFRLIERLGEPAGGDVWKALEEGSGREMALRMLPPAVARDAERLDRFKRDVAAVSGCGHPNIVVVHGIEEADGEHFFTMDLVQGRPLTSCFTPGGVSMERLTELSVPLVDAVRAAHGVGVIHRALRPGNVMVDEEGAVRVLAFGLPEIREFESDEAIDTDDIQTLTLTLTREGAILDALPYMSPEQVRGRPQDQRSDVFSLGTLMYELATGKRAFDGESSADVIASILGDQPRGVMKLNPKMPPLMGQLIFHCLEKKAERRFQSTQELGAALADIGE